jgi:acyl transferase domain-containing protein
MSLQLTVTGDCDLAIAGIVSLNKLPANQINYQTILL